MKRVVIESPFAGDRGRDLEYSLISVALGKRRGLVFAVGTDGADLRALLRHGQKAGTGRMTVHRQREPETVNA